jgi:hypothetical protein
MKKILIFTVLVFVVSYLPVKGQLNTELFEKSTVNAGAVLNNQPAVSLDSFKTDDEPKPNPSIQSEVWSFTHRKIPTLPLPSSIAGSFKELLLPGSLPKSVNVSVAFSFIISPVDDFSIIFLFN